jgi:hypothetical protein
MREDEVRRTKINRDAVDGGLKVRCPSKIAFDITACTSDREVKNCIILCLHQRFPIQSFKIKNSNLNMLFKNYAKMVVTTPPFVNSLF